MTEESKRIGGAPSDDDMVRPFGLSFRPEGHPLNKYEVATVVLTVPENTAPNMVHFVQVEYTIDSFYDLREAVNDLYDHIRQETP